MVSLFIWNSGQDGGEADEIALGLPDKAEEGDLARHVEKCALRYRMLMVRQKEIIRGNQRMELVLWVIVAAIVLTSHVPDKLFGLLGVG